MNLPPPLYQMYAIAKDNQIIGGTVSYSRAAAIDEILSRPTDKDWRASSWRELKKNGYRTVAVAIRIDQ